MTSPLIEHAASVDEPVPARSGSLSLARAVRLARLATRPAGVVVYVALALAAGLIEAAVIVLVVATAAGLTDGTGALDLDVGPFSASLSTSAGVAVGLGLTVALVLCGVPSAWLAARMAARLLTRIRARLLRSLVDAPWEQQATVLPAGVVDLAAVHAFRVANLVLVLAGLITNSLGLLALVAAAFLVDPVTAAALVVVVAVLAVSFRPLIHTVRRRSANHVAAHHLYVESLSNALGVLREVRIYGVREPVTKDVGAVNATAVYEYRQMMFRGLLVPALYLGATFALLLLGLAAASTQDSLDFTQVGAITLFLLRGLRYSRSAQGSWQSAMELAPHLDAVDDALERWEPTTHEPGRRRLEHVGRVELDDVSYAYPTGEVGIAGLTLTLEPGQIVGLEGPSGAGKSTIGQIVLGLRRPTSGRYLVDGVPVEEFDELDWHARFAYVAQDATLIRGTVRDNVRFLRPEISDDDIARAVEEAGLGPDLARWDRGLDRDVGAGGIELSGGQRQRITIARALAGAPDVIVMDEPTSALDAASEEIVRSTVEALRGRITVLLIAHRETTLSVCDRIVHVAGHRARERPVGAR